MGKRSPVLGYNHNFKHRGLIFHVQTEDSGVGNPHLFTHLFHGGVIISSRRMDYDADSEVDIVKSLMQSQHKAVLKDLKIGSFDDKIDSYLGHKPELLPRKDTDNEDTDPSNVSHAATIADAPVIEPVEAYVEASVPPDMDAEYDDTQDVTEAARWAAAAHKRRAATELAIDEITLEPPEKDHTPTIQRVEMLPSPAIHLDIPSANRPPPRMPTPTARNVMSEAELGDPMVTFAPKRPAILPEPAAPTEVPESDDNSGAYHIRRPNRGTTEHLRGRPLARGRQDPTPAKTFPTARASGKAANPQPGRPRSSVVVSRPAVIIGAPANIVGDKSKQRAPAARKARDGNLFGKDLISEKSLDEVIMAYLSEDTDDS